MVALLVYETLVATLAGTHIAPAGGLNCALRDRWGELWVEIRDGKERLGVVQGRLECCGFSGPGDRAVGGCEWSRGCLEPWRQAEKRVAAILLAVAVGVFVWMVRFCHGVSGCL